MSTAKEGSLASKAMMVKNYNEKGELAPRDIVTRAICFEMQKTGHYQLNQKDYVSSKNREIRSFW